MKRILRNWRWIARGGLAVGLGIALYMVMGPVERWTVKIDENEEDQFALTPDGTRVICQRFAPTKWDGPRRLRDGATGEVLAEFAGKDRAYEAPCSMLLSSGHIPWPPYHLGKRFWIGVPKDDLRTLDVFDLRSGEVHALELKPIANTLRGSEVIIAPTEDTMAIVTEETSNNEGMAENPRGVVHLFALPGGEHLVDLDVQYTNDEVLPAQFALDGSLFLYSAPNVSKPEVHIWDAERRCKAGVISTEAKTWNLSQNGRFLLAAGRDGRTKIWDLLESKHSEPAHVLPAGFGPNWLTVSRNSNAIADWVFEPEIVFWHRKTGEVGIVSLPPRESEHAVGTSWAVFSPDETLFAVIRADGEANKIQLTVIDVFKREVLWSISGCDPRPLSCFGADNTVFVVRDCEAQVRNAHSGKVLGLFRLPGSTYSAPLSGNGQFALVDSVGAPPEDLQTRVFTFLNDWLNAGISINNSRLLVIDLGSHREVFDLTNSSVQSLQLSEDGRTLLTVHGDEAGVYLRSWDVPARRAWLTIVGIPAGVFLLLAVVGGWRDRRRAKRTASSVAA
ncbi:MAG: WD40 repeat domain-containing protein [Planctomycetes bacterium]|nr:WD40 repeat domain-containing protein [Planctomycetota bacterium]